MTRPHEPHEQAVVATMILRPDTIPDLLDVVADSDFHSPKLRAAYRAIANVVARREPVDVTTLEAELSRAGDLALVGDPLALTDRAAAGVTQHHLHHARQVRVYAAVRELGAQAADIADDCRQLKLDPRTILDTAGERLAPSLAADTETEPMLSVVHRTFRGIVRRREGLTGVLTGLGELDDLMLGMDPGTLYVVGARPGMGKTAFYTTMARWNARRGVPAGLLSVEMPAAQVTERLLVADAGVDNQRVRAGTIDQRELARMVRAAERLVGNDPKTGLRNMPLDVIGDLIAPTMAHIRARARAWRRRWASHERVVLGIDYLGLVHGEGDTAEERIAYITRSCVELAKELRCPIVLLAQLNRGVEGRGDRRPRMSDLRGSGAIEQDADGILFVYRGALAGDDSMAKDEAEIILEKHRHGPTGTARVRYIGPRTLFCNLSRRPEDEDDDQAA